MPTTAPKETSQISDTMTSSSSSFLASEISSLSRLKESFLFPLYSEQALYAHIPKFLYVVLYLIQLLDYLETAFMFESRTFYPNGLQDWQSAYKGLIDLSVRTDNGKMSLLVGLSSYYLLSVFYFIYLYYSYKTSHKFSKMQLYTTKFMVVFINIFLMPVTVNTFCCVAIAALKTLKAKFIIVALTSFPVISISLLITYVSQQFLVKSPYMDRGLSTAWDGTFQLVFLGSICLNTALAVFSTILQPWMAYIVAGIVFTTPFYIYYKLYFLPYHHFFFNVPPIGIITGSQTATLLTAFGVTSRYAVAGAVVAGFIAGFVFFRFRRNKIIKRLSLSSLNGMTTIQYLDTLQFTSTKDIITHLTVGLEYQCELATDFSFPRYIFENYAIPEVLYFITTSFAFFPSQIQSLSYGLNVLSKFQNQSIFNEYLLYNLKRIHITRQSFTSNELNSVVASLQKKSTTMIGTVRGFWKEIKTTRNPISFQSLCTLREKVLQVESDFLDYISKYPNNSSISKLFFEFLVEGKADYKKAIEVQKQVLMIEQGKQKLVDYAFKGFVNVYPKYLTNNIVDIDGNFLNGIKRNATQSLFQNDNLEDENDVILGRMSEGKLRLSIQNTLEKSPIKPLKYSIYASVFQCFLSIGIFIVLYFFIPFLGGNIGFLYDELYHVTSMAQTFHYLGFFGSIQEAVMEARFDPMSMHTVVGANITEIMTTPSTTHLTGFILFEILNMFLTNYKEGLGEIYAKPLQQKTIISAANTEVPYYIYQASTPTIFAGVESLKTGISKFIDNQRIIGLMELGIIPKTIDNYKEVSLNSINFDTPLQNLMKVIEEKGEKEYSSLSKNLFSLIVYPSVICLLLCGIINFVSVNSLFKHNEYSANLLRKVRHDFIDKSFEPILTNSLKKIQYTSIHSPNQFDITKSSIAFVTASSLVFQTIFYVFSLFEAYNSVLSLKGLFVYLNKSLSKNSSSLSALSLAATSVLDANTANELLRNKTESTIHDVANYTIAMMHYDDRISQLLHNQTCPEGKELSHIDFLKCGSLLDLLSYNEKIFTNIIEDDSFDLNSYEFASTVFSVDHGLARMALAIHNLHYETTKNKLEDALQIIPYGIILAIVSAVIHALIQLYFYHKLYVAYDSFKMLILLLSPSDVLQSSGLNKLVANDVDKEEESMEIPDAILSHSNNGVISIGPDLVIRSVNQALLDITQFGKEDVLGNNIDTIIPEFQMKEHSTKIVTRSGVEKTVFIQPIPHHLTDDWTLLVHDRTEELIQREAIKKVNRRQSEIVDALVPEFVRESPFIRGEACVVQFQVAGLQRLAEVVAPKQLIIALKRLAEVIDGVTEGYKIRQIKFIDGSFIGCCGLYEKMEAREQGELVLEFLKDVKGKLKNANDFGFEFEISAGVDFGEVACGRLEAEFPGFDVLGKPARVAAALTYLSKTGCAWLSERFMAIVDTKKYAARRVKLPSETRMEGMFFSILL